MAGAKKSSASRKKTAEKGQAKARPQRKPGELSRFQKAVIILFIVIFAGSTLAGALASVVQSQNAQQSQQISVETMDESYEGTVSDLEAKVSENPDDTDSLLQLAQNLTSWGTSVMMLATTDDDVTHGNDLLDRAVSAYDDYLEHEDSASARVSRALCLYYQGKTDEAQTALEEATEAFPEDASAWQGLGAVLESQGKTDEAVSAYKKAVELDPDDEAGVKSAAEQRIEALEGTDDDSDAATDGSDAADDTNDSDGASADDAGAGTDGAADGE